MAVTVADIKSYLGDAAAQWGDPELTSVLAAEVAAQTSRCRTVDPRPADLDEALKRRVGRNLAMRKLPLGIVQSEVEGTRVGADPEIKRLEAPYRKLVVG